VKLTTYALPVPVCGSTVFEDVPVRLNRSSVVLVVHSIIGSQKLVLLEVANQPYMAYAGVDFDAQSMASITTCSVNQYFERVHSY
jgi:hypothetical protein